MQFRGKVWATEVRRTADSRLPPSNCTCGPTTDPKPANPSPLTPKASDPVQDLPQTDSLLVLTASTLG